eukprot:4283873-Amphidinium_carterae.1
MGFEVLKIRMLVRDQAFVALLGFGGMAEGREYILCPSASAAENKLGSELQLASTFAIHVRLYDSCEGRVHVSSGPRVRRLVDSVKESLPPLGQPEAGVTAAKCPFDESGTIVLSLEDDEVSTLSRYVMHEHGGLSCTERMSPYVH